MRKVRKSKTFGFSRKPRTKFEISKFEIAKLELHDGDIVVLRTDLILGMNQAQELRDRAREQFPGIHVVILSGGMSLAVVSDKRSKRAA